MLSESWVSIAGGKFGNNTQWYVPHRRLCSCLILQVSAFELSLKDFRSYTCVSCFWFLVSFIVDTFHSVNGKHTAMHRSGPQLKGTCQGMGDWARIWFPSIVDRNQNLPKVLQIFSNHCNLPLRHQIYCMRAKKGYFSFSRKSYFR